MTLQMEQSIRVIDAVGKAICPALTELLGLDDCNVVGYEIHEPEEVLILELLLNKK